MGIVLGLTWMTVTGTAGALGVCGLADLTSEQPAPQSSQSDKATANGHHERLVRLSCFIAIVFLHPCGVCTPRADATEPCPTETEVSKDTTAQALPRAISCPLLSWQQSPIPRVRVAPGRQLQAPLRLVAILRRGLTSAVRSGNRNSTSALSSCPSGITWPLTWRSCQWSRPLAPYRSRRTTLAELDAHFHEALEKGARLKSNAEASASGADGQAPNRVIHHHRGHFHRGVWLSSLASTASVLG